MWTRNAFLLVAALELGALAFARRQRAARALRVASGVLGLVGIAIVYRTSEQGGALVYNYAGGVGVRSNRPEDLTRLLVAGLYHNTQAARSSSRPGDAARYVDELVRQMPGDATVRLMAVESLIRDRHDPRAALIALDALEAPPDNRRVLVRWGLLRIEAYRALGLADSAEAVVADLKQRYPDDARIDAALEQMTRAGGGR